MAFPIQNGTNISLEALKTASTYTSFDSVYKWTIVDGQYPMITPTQVHHTFPNTTVNKDGNNLTQEQMYTPATYTALDLVYDWNGVAGSYPDLILGKVSKKFYDKSINKDGNDCSVPYLQNLSNYTNFIKGIWENVISGYPYLVNNLYASDVFPNDNQVLAGKDGLDIPVSSITMKNSYDLDFNNLWSIKEGVSLPSEFVELGVYNGNTVFPNENKVLAGKDGLSLTLEQSKMASYYELDFINMWEIEEGISAPKKTIWYTGTTAFPNENKILTGKDGASFTKIESMQAATYALNFIQIWTIDEGKGIPSAPISYIGDTTFPNENKVLSGKDGMSITALDIITDTTYELDFIYKWLYVKNRIPKIPTISQPIISLESGEYKTATTVEMSGDEWATIVYALNSSSAPTKESSMYIAPFKVAKTGTLQAMAVYEYGGVTYTSDIVTKTYRILDDVDLVKPYFDFKYNTFNEITAYDGICDVKFSVYNPTFKVLDKVSDFDLFQTLDVGKKKVLSIRANNFFDVETDVVMINSIPIDYMDDIVALEENNYLYLSHDFIDKNTIDSVTIIQSDSYTEKKISSNLPATIDGKTIIRIKDDGSVNLDTVTNIPNCLHVIFNTPMLPIVKNDKIFDEDKLFGNYGICVSDDNKIVVGSPVHINQNSVINTTSKVILVPYLHDSFNKSYYEKFVKRFLSEIYANDTNSIIKVPDEYLNSIKFRVDYSEINNYGDILNDVYKHDIGIYEKMLIEDFKSHYQFKKGEFETKNELIKFWYDNSSEMVFGIPKLKVMVENEDHVPLEYYVNNKILGYEPMVFSLAGVDHIYIGLDQIFDDYFLDIYNVVKPPCTLNEFKVIWTYRESELYYTYQDIIDSSITISILKKRSDYNRFLTGFVEWNRNWVEIPDIFEDAYGASVYMDGLLQSPEDYYVEYIGGVLCIVFKRVTSRERVNVVLTSYTHPICIEDRYIEYTSEDFHNTLTCLDEVYVNGHLVSNDDIYTVDSYRNILGIDTLGDDIDRRILIRTYHDKALYDSSIGKDYRSILIDKLNMMDYICSTMSVKKVLSGKTRKHNNRSIDEYVFYLKYIQNATHEKKDVYIASDDISDISGFTPLSEKEIAMIKYKYASLFDNNNNIIFESQGDDNDYPTDIIFGDTIDIYAYPSYVNTAEYVKNNLIPDGDDIIFDSNYRGEKLEI